MRKYEYIYQKADWRDRWNVPKFPTILIGITHMAPAHGYKQDIDQRQQGMGVKCKYMIKSITKLMKGDDPRLSWLDLERNQFFNILKV